MILGLHKNKILHCYSEFWNELSLKKQIGKKQYFSVKTNFHDFQLCNELCLFDFQQDSVINATTMFRICGLSHDRSCLIKSTKMFSF